jgi:hypothetical protein
MYISLSLHSETKQERSNLPSLTIASIRCTPVFVVKDSYESFPVTKTLDLVSSNCEYVIMDKCAVMCTLS